MNESLIYLLLVIFLVFTVIFKILITNYVSNGKYTKRVNDLITTTDEEELAERKSQQSDKSSFVKKWAGKLEGIFKLEKHEKLLLQSGVNITQGEFFIGRTFFSIIVICAGYLYDLHVVFLIICGWIGFQLPILYVKKKRKKRLQKCADQLSVALGSIANSLRAGFSFMQAMKMVASELDDPVGPEFLKVINDINYGVPFDDAFTNLLERLPNKELDIMVRTLIIQRVKGGNIAFLLETLQETIFDRARVKDEVNTLTAQGRMSSIIITILPIVIAIYLSVFNPEYLSMLFTHPLGWAMVGIGVINLLLGWIFIKKIVHIEV